MGCILMAYASGGYQEFILPDIDNADYKILLNKRIFGMGANLELPLEIVDGVWRFVKSKELLLQRPDGAEGAGQALKDGLILYLNHREAGRIALVVLVCKEPFPLFSKYSLGQINQVTIGKEKGNHVEYEFRELVSANHAVLFRNGSYWVVEDHSSNGTYLNGSRIRRQTILKFGDQITLFGLRIIFLESCLGICALSGGFGIDENRLPRFYPQEEPVLSEQPQPMEKKPYFKRAPRIVEKLYTDKIEIEGPPQLTKTKKRPLLLTIGPSMTMAIPMLLGCVMSILSSRLSGGSSGIYMFTGLVTAVSSGLIGVLWALTNIRNTNREEEENEELRYNVYGQYLIDITEFIKQKYDENRNIMYRTWLSGRECCAFGASDSRLWNHNSRQADFLTLRLGTGTLPFQAEISVPKERFKLLRDDLEEKPGLIRDNYQMLRNVPFCLDIRSAGLIGIIGGNEKRGAYEAAWNMAAQLAANNCYTEVKLVFIYDENQAPEGSWSFARWLPHVWTEDHRTRMIAGNKKQLGDICYELSKVLQKRMEEERKRKDGPLPHFVIFVDSMELLEGELLERLIYNPRPEYGITAILLAQRYEELPNNCENIIQNDGVTSRFFHIYREEEESKELIFDSIAREDLEQLARRICGVEVREDSETGEIPSGLEFLEMYGVSTLKELRVMERWKKNRNYESMRVPIGQKAGGNLCFLDVHEKYHGPHGLVAGTTGSGKSETLQTWILSMAINFSPDDAAFFIIDFKGAGMANQFLNLPHMAGHISNLSGNQIERAMISIKSENLRRQRIFAEHGVNNINLYTGLYKNHEAKLPVPHLFIIIDEFAELKREEPEFMKELISVAQVGRSLGVHLILATQKPSGTVDDNIWSNSRFRLCLRVQDRQDSNDMLHKPDAAYITQPGRGYLQVGSDEIYEQFQSGYSGAEFAEDAGQKGNHAVLLSLTGRESRAGRARKKTGNVPVKTKSQLNAVIDYLKETAEKNGYGRRSLLWLPVLPEQLYLKALLKEKSFLSGAWAEHQGKWKLETVVGMYDDPSNQAQKPFGVSFSEGGHLAVCGMVATGKSTFLQTLLYSLILNFHPGELNFYILDYSSRLLKPFEKAPHCGGVVLDTETDKGNKLFYMLDKMLEERKALFGGGSYSQYIKAQGREHTPPAVLLVLDNCANFREKTGGRFDEQLLRISREGVNYGIYLVLSAAGFGVSEIPTRIGDNIRTLIALEMSDKFKYAEILHTTRVSILPEKGVKGRGLAWVGERLLEFQTALALEGEESYERSSEIEKQCERMKEFWKGECARTIPTIPEHPTLQDFTALTDYQRAAKQGQWLPMGYDAQDASVYSVDLWTAYCYMIQGRNRSGKKNVLKLLIHGALSKQDAEVVLIDLAGSGFAGINENGRIQKIESREQMYRFFESTIAVIRERSIRKKQLLEEGLDETETAKRMSLEKPYFIFITDLSVFVKAACEAVDGLGSIQAYMENITGKGCGLGFYFFAALNPEDHSSLLGYTLYKNMTSYGTGIHLGGNVNAQRLYQFNGMSIQEQGSVMKPGTGLVPAEEITGKYHRVVLPLAKGKWS